MRIPGPKGSRYGPGAAAAGPVVIYQHGMLDCCAGIVCDGEDSLGLRLVNQGYDLWLPNSRGTRYSRANLDPEEDEGTYWEFSFQEMAKYDQPALWKFIEGITGKSEAIFIGHSQGNAQMFAAICEQPEFWRPRMKLFIAIAPVIYIENCQSAAIAEMAECSDTCLAALSVTGPEIFATANASNPLKEWVVTSAFGQAVADYSIQQLSDLDPAKISKKANTNYNKFYPAGTSV